MEGGRVTTAHMESASTEGAMLKPNQTHDKHTLLLLRGQLMRCRHPPFTTGLAQGTVTSSEPATLREGTARARQVRLLTGSLPAQHISVHDMCLHVVISACVICRVAR